MRGRTAYRSGPPGYVSYVTDLVGGLLLLARTPAEHRLVLDLVDRITVYDMKTKTAETRRLPDGRYETTLTIDAGNYYAHGKGVEKAAPLADRIPSVCSMRARASAASPPAM